MTAPREAPTCLHCGYDLRRLPVDGRCPECGMGALQSVITMRLACAPTAWLAHLEATSRWMSIALRLPLLASIGGISAVILLWTDAALAGAALLAVTALVVVVALPIALYLGALEMGMPDPAGLWAARLEPWRQRLALTAAVALAGWLVPAPFMLSGSFRVGVPAVLVELTLVVATAAAYQRYLVELARRASRPELARRLRRTLWMPLAVVGGWALVSAAAALIVCFPLSIPALAVPLGPRAPVWTWLGATLGLFIWLSWFGRVQRQITKGLARAHRVAQALSP